MEKVRYAFEINDSKLNDSDKLFTQIVKVKDYLAEKNDIIYKNVEVKIMPDGDQFLRNKQTVLIDFQLLNSDDWISEYDYISYDSRTGKITKVPHNGTSYTKP